MKVRSRVYVSGPISIGDVVGNCQRAIKIGFELMDKGYAPFVPHYSYFVDMQGTAGQGRYEQWISVDLSYISVCHALLRLKGNSAGADREVDWAVEIGVPVFYDLKYLCDMVPSWTQLKLN